MKYLLSGYYGRRNTGDDALLYATLAGLSKLDAEARFSVISPEPLVAPPGVALSVSHPDSARFITLRRLLQSNCWVFGGGGVIQDNHSRSLGAMKHLLRLARIARLAQRRILLLGIGLGPLQTAEGRSIAARLLQMADFVTVRDPESAALAAEIGVTRPVAVTADLVLGLLRDLPAATAHEPGRSKILGLSLLDVSYFLGPAFAGVDLLPAIGEALKKWLRSHPDWRIRMFAFHGSPDCGDAAVLEQLAGRIAEPDRIELLPYEPDCAEVFEGIARCDAFVGMRLHSCVLSYMAGVPTLFLDYHPKCTAFARFVEAPAEAVLSLSNLKSADLLSARLDLLTASGSRMLPGLPPLRAAAQSSKNFALLGSWFRENGFATNRVQQAVQ